MRIDLNVPYSEKDEARKLGARWDAKRQLWYLEEAVNLGDFLKWMSSLHQMAYRASR